MIQEHDTTLIGSVQDKKGTSRDVHSMPHERTSHLRPFLSPPGWVKSSHISSDLSQNVTDHNIVLG
jgi:hypothetical protein